ncbi:MAG: hypothetical protein R6U08_09185 [Bacillota bacterium]
MDDRVDIEFREIRVIIAERLVGETIRTLARQKPNLIVDADEEGVTVRARTEGSVPWEWIEDVYEILVQEGEIEAKDLQQGELRVRGGFRSSFIFALLAQFAHVEPRVNPIGLTYREPHGPIRLAGGHV